MPWQMDESQQAVSIVYALIAQSVVKPLSDDVHLNIVETMFWLLHVIATNMSSLNDL